MLKNKGEKKTGENENSYLNPNRKYDKYLAARLGCDHTARLRRLSGRNKVGEADTNNIVS
jgi:hypothetical protein